MQTYVDQLDFSKGKVARCLAVKIYFSIEGRNAWWSTWKQTYTEGCMQLKFNSSKTILEEKRKQGSVFNIIEMPAIVFQHAFGGCLVVTQINTQSPLKDYFFSRAFKRVENSAGEKDHFHGVAGRKIMKDIPSSFDFNSDSWRIRPPEENSVIKVWYPAGWGSHFDDLSRTLVTYKSVSEGSRGSLEWEKSDSDIKVDFVKRTCEKFAQLLQED